MKKIISIVAIFAILMVGAMSVVNAASSSTLADQLYAIGSKYGMTAADKVKMERYLSDNPLSNNDCNQILAEAQEADKIMQENGTTDYKSLPADVKAQLKSLANEAADIAGVTLDFSADGIDVFKDGKQIESYSGNSNKLPYTGNNSIVLVVSSIAVIALVAVVARKKLANA